MLIVSVVQYCIAYGYMGAYKALFEAFLGFSALYDVLTVLFYLFGIYVQENYGKLVQIMGN